MIEQSSTTQTINTATTVNEIIAVYPETVAVFNEFGIDACCGGDAPLSEAARRDGASVDSLLAALDAVRLRRETP